MTAHGLTQLHVVRQNSKVNAAYYEQSILPVYFDALRNQRNIISNNPLFTCADVATIMQDGASLIPQIVVFRQSTSYYECLGKKGMARKFT
jgi:hypothetical protein